MRTCGPKNALKGPVLRVGHRESAPAEFKHDLLWRGRSSFPRQKPDAVTLRDAPAHLFKVLQGEVVSCSDQVLTSLRAWRDRLGANDQIAIPHDAVEGDIGMVIQGPVDLSAESGAEAVEPDPQPWPDTPWGSRLPSEGAHLKEDMP